jgi:ATP-dependent Clp protease ATP-binding subunit ClpC
LKRREVSYRNVRKIIDSVGGKGTKRYRDVSQLIPTSRVKKVILIACREASTEGAETVGTEHILLALMVEGEGIAAHVLSDLGVTPALTRTAMGRLDDNAGGVSHPQRGPWSLIARLLRKP